MLSVVSNNTQRGIDARLKLVQQEAATQLNVHLLAEFKSALRATREEHRLEVAKLRAEVSDTLKACHDWTQQREEEGIKIETIIVRILRATKVSESDVMSDRQTKQISLSRQAICYWAARLTGLSAAGVGRHLGRDHTTVLHAMSKYPIKRAAMGRTVRRLR